MEAAPWETEDPDSGSELCDLGPGSPASLIAPVYDVKALTVVLFRSV